MVSPNASPFAPQMLSAARVAAIRGQLAEDASRVTAVIVGAGKSGMAAKALLDGRGAKTCVVDDKVAPIAASDFEGADLVVLSPGVPRSRPELAAAIERGILVGEIELASWFVKAPMVGITGTNGKSTTTALTAHILASSGRRTFVGGNLGRPLADLVASEEEVDVAVVELSSYQLESIVDATFDVACWLNLTPDHTDRYPNVEAYAAAKQRILERRSVRGIAVLNAKDPTCSLAGIQLGGPIRWFAADYSSDLASRSGTLLSGPDDAIRRGGPEVEERYHLDNRRLPGMHNRANMIAALECARHMGATPAEVQAGLLSFTGLAHRLELVGTARGARWYNDSKATNVDSTSTALRALEGRKILIAGGKDKGAPWAPLRELAGGSVVAVLAIGEATQLVVEAFTGAVPIVERVGTLDRAVARAAEICREGDLVLLSPACASFDQFKNFEHRGDAFRALVSALAAEETP